MRSRITWGFLPCKPSIDLHLTRLSPIWIVCCTVVWWWCFPFGQSCSGLKLLRLFCWYLGWYQLKHETIWKWMIMLLHFYWYISSIFNNNESVSYLKIIFWLSAAMFKLGNIFMVSWSKIITPSEPMLADLTDVGTECYSTKERCIV